MYTELIDDDRHLRQTPLQQLAENERRLELELEIAKVKSETRAMDDLRHKQKLAAMGYDPSIDTGEFAQVYAADLV